MRAGWFRIGASHHGRQFGGVQLAGIGALVVAVFLGVVAVTVLYPALARAQWWSSAPKDYEDCVAAAAAMTDSGAKAAKTGECESAFAGRRKAGGGYTYYDLMQNRRFDIAGPNPTPAEQRSSTTPMPTIWPASAARRSRRPLPRSSAGAPRHRWSRRRRWYGRRRWRG